MLQNYEKEMHADTAIGLFESFYPSRQLQSKKTRAPRTPPAPDDFSYVLKPGGGGGPAG